MTDSLEKEILDLLADLKEKSIQDWIHAKTIKDFCDTISWFYVLHNTNISEEFLDFIFKYLGWNKRNRETNFSEYSFCLLGNTSLSFQTRIKYFIKYRGTEKEKKKHFIQYSKVKNKVKDFKIFIDNI